jgi:hypothetical protein
VLLVLVVVTLALNKMGYLYDWTNGRLGSPKAASEQKVAPAPATLAEAPLKR